MVNQESLVMKWLRLRKEVEEAQREADRADGSLDTFELEIIHKWGFNSYCDLKAELKRLEEEKTELTEQFEKKLNDFQVKWTERLK